MVISLIIFNVILLILIFFLLRQIDKYNSLKRNYSTIVVLQKIMDVLGKRVSSKEKLEEINNIFLHDYGIMFSTIVYFSGDEHKVKASNVDSRYFPILESLSEEPLFKQNCENNVPKYVTATSGTGLKYSEAENRGIKSAIFLPLLLGENYVGYWLLEDIRSNAFDRLEKVQLSILKNNLGLILENSNYQSTIEKMAVRDKLTGLHNRNYLYNEGKAMIDKHAISTVVICDIDFFKKVNDTYGHDIGDKVLINVAQTTQRYLSEDDVLVRFGGEEFVILFPGKDMEICKLKIEKIREVISSIKFYITETKIMSVTVSYGMSTYEHGHNIDIAIKSADVALYRAKQNGRNRVEIA